MQKNILITSLMLFALIQSTNSQNTFPASKIDFGSIKNQTDRIFASGTHIYEKNVEEDDEREERKIQTLEVAPGTKIFSSFNDANGAVAESKPWEPNVARKKKTGNLLQSPVTLSNNFLGLSDNAAVSYPSGSFFSYIPPDTYGSAGPNHLMVVLNTQYRIMSKTGTVVSTVDAEDFWKGTAGYYAPPITTNVATGHSDPHVKYDPVSNRWILVAQTNADNFSSLLVAVSQTNDPTGTWNRYCIDVDASNVVMFDFPLVGFTSNWLVVTGNMFNISTGAFADHQIYVFDKANLYAGGAVTLGTNAQRIAVGGTTQSGWSSPATVISGGTANTMYLLQPFFTSGGNAGVRTTTLTGTIPSVTWNTGSATFSTSPLGNFATASSVANGNTLPQKNDIATLNSGDGRFCESYQVNGNLWTAQHVYLPATQPVTRSAIQWWQLQTSGTILQNGRIDDGTGQIHRAYPSMAVNNSEDVAIGYSIASLDRFVSCAYATRRSCTPANQMDKEVVFKDGVDTYTKNFGGSRIRWGDYSNTSIDPATGTFWTIQQYANTRTSSTASGSKWSTWWAEITPDANNVIAWSANSSQYTSETGNTGTCPRYKDVNLTISAMCAATGSATLTVSGSGTATSGVDYQILTPSITFNNGDASKTVTIRIFDDAEVESAETLNLTYSISGVGVAAGTEYQTAAITINDNDAAPVVQSTSGTVILGQGNIINGLSNLPLRAATSDLRCQFLYTAAELNAMGLVAGNITELSLDVLQKLSTIPYSGFTIGMKNTASTTLSTTTGLESGVTTVYTGSFTSAAGTNVFVLSAPFNWDGTSSLLIEMCYDNSAANSSDQVKSSTVAASMAIWKTATSGSGCSLAATGSLFNSVSGLNTVRPDIRLKGVLKGNPVETALVTTTINLGPNTDVYIYDAAGNIQARIKNLTAFDYGCTQVEIDRAGSSSVQFWNNTPNNYLASKSFKVIPTNNTASGHYQITLYYSSAEVTGWQTATTQTWANAQMVKVSNGFYIPDVTPATPHTSDVSTITATPGSLGSDYTIMGDFNNTGFSGFGVGVPSAPLPVTMVYFVAYKKEDNAILDWRTTFEQNNKGFEIEKSYDGVNFFKIDFVKGAGNSVATNNYTYTDKSKLTSIQYYRIKQIDFDSRAVLSNIQSVKADIKTLDLLSVTNPFNNTISIVFTKPLTKKINVELFDASGKKVYSYSKQPSSQTNINLLLDQNLSKGTYIIHIDAGDDQFVRKLVKQ
jgi:hypothetical protein